MTESDQLEFHSQIMIREKCFDDILATLKINSQDIPVILKVELVENPSPPVLAKAQVKLINRLIFDAIQEVQASRQARTNEQVYEYVKQLDHELDSHLENSFKIKDRDTKKEIIQEIQDCKDKTRSIMDVLRSASGKISNTQIALLNDMAYKAVRKQGL